MKNTINLLPRVTPEEVHTKQRKRRNGVILIAAFAIIFAAWLIPFVYMQKVLHDQSDVEDHITQEKQVLKSLAGTEKLYKDVYTKAAGANTIFVSQKAAVQNLTNLRGILFDGIILSSFTIQKGKLTVNVQATDIANIIAFISNLEEQNTQRTIPNANSQTIAQIVSSIPGQSNQIKSVNTLISPQQFIKDLAISSIVIDKSSGYKVTFSGTVTQ